ncbi:hypothetical protein C5S42_00175 [Candidatus Methanomarinus sp.]|nr:hypothetical protein C5S42_00175 [ANME-2 cluster archaeon]
MKVLLQSGQGLNLPITESYTRPVPLHVGQHIVYRRLECINSCGRGFFPHVGQPPTIPVSLHLEHFRANRATYSSYISSLPHSYNLKRTILKSFDE